MCEGAEHKFWRSAWGEMDRTRKKQVTAATTAAHDIRPRQPRRLCTVSSVHSRPRPLLAFPSPSMSVRTALVASSRLRRPARPDLRPGLLARNVSSHHLPSEPSVSQSKFVLLSSTLSSRSVLKATSPSAPGPANSREQGPGELSDQEWEIRTGTLGCTSLARLEYLMLS